MAADRIRAYHAGMAWYTVKTYEGPDPAVHQGEMIDTSIFEADDDESAKLVARKHSLLAVRGTFANLLNASDKILLTMVP